MARREDNELPTAKNCRRCGRKLSEEDQAGCWPWCVACREIPCAGCGRRLTKSDVGAERQHWVCEDCCTPIARPGEDAGVDELPALDQEGRRTYIDATALTRYYIGARGKWYSGKHPRQPDTRLFAAVLVESAIGRWYAHGDQAASEAAWPDLIARRMMAEGKSESVESEYVEIDPLDATALLDRASIPRPISLEEAVQAAMGHTPGGSDTEAIAGPESHPQPEEPAHAEPSGHAEPPGYLGLIVVAKLR